MVVLFVATRNEAEMLRQNLAHHLGWGFDHVAIADNESTDATRDVLREFDDAVTVATFRDPAERFAALPGLLARIEERYGAADWVAVSDTDEFWWTPEADLRSTLARIPDRLVAVNSDQKLFLNTQLDAVTGPVYCRRTFRTTSTHSPLHTSYQKGKSLYRGAWLREYPVLNPHWSRNVPHSVWRFERPLVHHYMIDGEDSFVQKVTVMEHKWNPQVRGLPERSEPIPVSAFKMAWWRVFEVKGEGGLRDYYREEYVVSASSLPIHIGRGELVEDTEFADFKRSSPDVRRNVTAIDR